ncbi:MAG: transposase [Gloeobacteraceae cyanobacterium ES-bin-144]|nr:transposase [Verrucomicrobiales bacterium]
MSVSNRRRWIVPWKDSRTKPAIYHCISRVVDRRFAFEVDEREHFRMLMRMCEKFTGCRVLSYCVMSNHFHILLEVPPMPVDGISDEELFERLGVFYSEAQVAEIAKEMTEAATPRKRGEFEMAPVDANGVPLTKARESAMAKQQASKQVAEIRSRYTRRMHDLSEFMKSLLERFTKWFNRMHSRSGTLWEERYKSVIVESGVAARTMAAYIDLNPVRAGMMKDPADYRWSSYGEAVGGGKKGDGKKAREGLLRAYFCDQGVGFEAEKWPEVSRLYRRVMGLALVKKPGRAVIERRSQTAATVTKHAEEMLESDDNQTVLKDLKMAQMLRCRVRYFTDGAVIGSRSFVNETFAMSRERFGMKRKDGARAMKGNGSEAKGLLWSMRDLQVGV